MVGGSEVVGEATNLHHLLGRGKTEAPDQLQLSFTPTVFTVARSRVGGLGGVEDVVHTDPVGLEGAHLPHTALYRPQAQSLSQTSPLHSLSGLSGRNVVLHELAIV